MSDLFTDEIRLDEEAQRRVREWIDALRSGRYQQAQRLLRVGDGFCCLGVACDLYDSEGWGIGGEGWIFADHADTALPDDVMAAYRVATEEGGYRGNSLAGLNDEGHTFAEIADVIECELAEALA